MFCFVFVVVLAYAVVYFRFDESTITQRISKTKKNFATNNALSSLVNTSGINNIPSLNIISTNTSVTMANNCGKSPVRIGDVGSDVDCVLACANSSAKVMNISKRDTYIFDSVVLTSGAHCFIGTRPECNMKTTIAIMTVNSIVCRPKFPRAFGGPLGNKIVACNSSKFYDPKNVFWDGLKNKAVDPKEGLSDANELDVRFGPDNQYRFFCKFEGTDIQGNNYIEHPFERLQPMRNYCASMIHRAHTDVRTIFSDDGQNFSCDCGDFRKTNVLNVYPSDHMSPCSDKTTHLEYSVKSLKKLFLTYPCFTLFSPMSDAGKYFPCPPEQFTRQGSKTSTVTISFSNDESELIEHPGYDKFSRYGSLVDNFGKRIV